MNTGRIAQEGTPADLYERPADAFVADFIGGANLIPCELISLDGEGARIHLGSLDLSLARAGKVGVGPALVVVRPNSVDLAAAPEPGRSFPVTVRKAVYLGDHWEYTLDTPVGELFVTQPIERRFTEGSTVHVVLWPERLTLVAQWRDILRTGINSLKETRPHRLTSALQHACRRRLMALLGSANRDTVCRLSGGKQTWSLCRLIDAYDPNRTRKRNGRLGPSTMQRGPHILSRLRRSLGPPIKTDGAEDRRQHPQSRPRPAGHHRSVAR